MALRHGVPSHHEAATLSSPDWTQPTRGPGAPQKPHVYMHFDHCTVTRPDAWGWALISPPSVWHKIAPHPTAANPSTPRRPNTPANMAAQKRIAPAAAAAALALVVAVALAALVPAVHAHAVMLNPQSRPWYDYLLRYNYNPHAVYAGGVDAVSKGGKLQWPQRNRYSICGDAAGERKWDTPGPIAGSGKYKAGQTIDVDILFAQNHLGRLQMRLCPLDAKDESACRTLER